MLTGIILAGGSSSRMGKDKALLGRNVERLHDALDEIGCERVLIMCGSPERAELFDGECVVDEGECLAESIRIILGKLEGAVQLVPCDAYLADAELLASITGVPVDQTGKRQPLMVRLSSDSQLIESDRIEEMFSLVPSCEGGLKACNTNTPEELREIRSLLQRDGR